MRLSNEKAPYRRKNVITFLENQLKDKTKNTKEGKVPLTEHDTKRIKEEIETLKSRIGY